MTFDLQLEDRFPRSSISGCTASFVTCLSWSLSCGRRPSEAIPDVTSPHLPARSVGGWRRAGEDNSRHCPWLPLRAPSARASATWARPAVSSDPASQSTGATDVRCGVPGESAGNAGSLAALHTYPTVSQDVSRWPHVKASTAQWFAESTLRVRLGGSEETAC